MRKEAAKHRQHLIDIGLGKKVNEAIYVHVSAIEGTGIGDWVQALATEHEVESFNLVKFSPPWQGGSVSLMWYPEFWEEGFPALERSWTLKCEGDMVARRYRKNRPILHRKETFLRQDHEKVPEFQALTEQAEELGLFADTSRIGWSYYWGGLLALVGYRVEGNTLVQD